MAAAAVSKELRATLADLAPEDADDPFLAELSAPLVDAKKR